MIITKKTVECLGNGTFYSDGSTPHGEIIAFYVEYESGCAAVTDVTVYDEYGEDIIVVGYSYILSLSNNNTSKWVYPRKLLKDNSGSNIDYTIGKPVHDKFPMIHRMKVVVAQNNSDKTVKVNMFIEEY